MTRIAQILWILSTLTIVLHAGSECCAAKADKTAATCDVTASASLEMPDLHLTDQNGKKVAIRELVKGDPIAFNFIFTSCTTICPPMGVNFAQFEKLLAKDKANKVRLVSVSIDPRTDTPARLKQWRQRFGGTDAWTLLTGVPSDVNSLLKAFEVFTPDKNEHAPFVLISDGAGQWQRINGLTAPEAILEQLTSLTEKTSKQASKTAVPDGNEASRSWFTNIALTDQHGKQHRLYDDLIKDKKVVVHSFFSSCKGVCPVMFSAVKKVKRHIGERLGRDVVILSISVDPLIDTPEKLKPYAADLGSQEGWYFLTGSKETVDKALHRFGFYVEQREAHSNLVIMGNDKTGLWKKALGLAGGPKLIDILDQVLADKGAGA